MRDWAYVQAYEDEDDDDDDNVAAFPTVAPRCTGS